MIREIYTRSADDPAFDPTVIEVTDPLEMLLTKIRMVLGTSNGEVLGDYSMGIGLEEMVFKTKMSSSEVEKKIQTQFDEYVNGDGGYKVSAKVKFGHHADGYDYATVDIYVNDLRIQGYLID